ncbi:glutathione S-transferase family protein [Pseudooceanicola algae]|uniref:Uncharacterized protein n=1 Tax=Pseudooceanicola algae TaxID=1537215 RepID=A0A418SH99_9RHOB|nr:glutathione S-transferase family protein [Pseudooceanicola algae]QPM90427.1 hypothetical protein PSAL_016650 [Pseudooceanicola algae]
MKLYSYELSAECYKVRFFLSVLGLTCDVIGVDEYPGQEQQGEAFRAIAPLGRLPVLATGDGVIEDAQAILTYLALRHDPTGIWYPVDDPLRVALCGQWMGFGAALDASAGQARRALGMFAPLDVAAAQGAARGLLRQLDEHLWFAEQDGEAWLVPGEAPSIADLACFPAIALAEEGGVMLTDYPALRRWLDRVKRIPGFITMSGIFGTSPAPEG